MLRKVVQPFYTAWVVATFVASLLLAFPLFFIASIGATRAGRRAIYNIIRTWAFGWLWLIGMPLRRQGHRPPKGRYVIVSNHISYLDTLIIFPAVPGYFRALGKIEISKIPVLGFVYRQIVVMVDRSSSTSRAHSMRQMRRVLRTESNIVIFPEGTFNETGAPLKDFYNGAFRLAIESQTPILPMLLPDTVGRWHYKHWWALWPGKNRAIYLPPVPIEGLTTDDVPALKQQVYALMETELVKLGNGNWVKNQE